MGLIGIGGTDKLFFEFVGDPDCYYRLFAEGSDGTTVAVDLTLRSMQEIRDIFIETMDYVVNDSADVKMESDILDSFFHKNDKPLTKEAYEKMRDSVDQEKSKEVIISEMETK